MSKEEESLAAEDGETKADLESSLEKKLSEIEQKVDTSQVMGRIMSDPLVREVLEARARGETELRLEKGQKQEQESEEEEEQEEEDETSLDNMSNAQLSTYMAKKLSGSLSKLLKKELEPLVERTEGVEQYMKGAEAKRAEDEVTEAKAKHKDIAVFRERMMALHQQNPGLKVEQLYTLAKDEAGGLVDKESQTETEKPTGTSSRPGLSKQRKAALPPGRQGFSVLLEEALSKVPTPEFEER